MAKRCKYHPKVKTEFKCSKCGAFVCNECLEYRYEYIYCKRCIMRAKKIGIKLVLVGGFISSLIFILLFFVIF